MNNLSEIRKQIDDLKKIEASILQKEKHIAIATVKKLISDFELTNSDIDLSDVYVKKTAKKIPAEKIPHAKIISKVKYQRGTETWSGGRGPKPKWIKELVEADQDIEQYRIAN
jgi:DNA-binding protein H-NS